MNVWPYRPQSDTVEVFEFLTDVIRCRSSEQRIALRDEPRVKLIFQHLIDEIDANNAKSIIRKNVELRIPDWINRNSISSIIAGAPTVVVDFAPLVEVGQSVVVWSSDRAYEICEVTAKTGSSITINLAASRFNCFVMRLLDGLLESNLQLGRSSSTLYDLNPTFTVFGYVDQSALSVAQYRSIDICPLTPIIISTIQERFAWPTEVIDNSFGIVKHIRERSFSDDTFELRFLEYASASKATLRRFVYAKLGRQKAFWASTNTLDFEIAQNVPDTQNYIRVFKIDPYADLSRPTLDICISLKNGSKLYRRVNSFTAGADLGGRATFNLMLDSTLPAIAVTQVAKISVLYLCRFNTDRVELINQYQGSDALSVSIPCIEVVE